MRAEVFERTGRSEDVPVVRFVPPPAPNRSQVLSTG